MGRAPKSMKRSVAGNSHQAAILDLNQNSPRALLYLLLCMLAAATAKEAQLLGRSGYFVTISTEPRFAGLSSRDRHRFLFIDRSLIRLSLAADSGSLGRGMRAGRAFIARS
jgi:hypothetical protein